MKFTTFPNGYKQVSLTYAEVVKALRNYYSQAEIQALPPNCEVNNEGYGKDRSQSPGHLEFFYLP